jgi:hypothetical protein
VSHDAFVLEPAPGNHALRSMTNVSRLGTTSARRKGASGLPLKGEGRKGAVGAPASARVTRSVSQRRSEGADPSAPAQSVFRTAQRLAFSCKAPKERSD